LPPHIALFPARPLPYATCREPRDCTTRSQSKSRCTRRQAAIAVVCSASFYMAGKRVPPEPEPHATCSEQISACNPPRRIWLSHPTLLIAHLHRHPQPLSSVSVTQLRGGVRLQLLVSHQCQTAWSLSTRERATCRAMAIGAYKAGHRRYFSTSPSHERCLVPLPCSFPASPSSNTSHFLQLHSDIEPCWTGLCTRSGDRIGSIRSVFTT